MIAAATAGGEDGTLATQQYAQPPGQGHDGFGPSSPWGGQEGRPESTDGEGGVTDCSPRSSSWQQPALWQSQGPGWGVRAAWGCAAPLAARNAASATTAIKRDTPRGMDEA